MRLNKDERKVLACLAQCRDSYSDSPLFRGFAGIAEDTGLDRKAVRRAARSLARKGLAEYQRGLWTEDGEMAGAGYGCTKEGAAIAATFPETEAAA